MQIFRLLSFILLLTKAAKLRKLALAQSLSCVSGYCCVARVILHTVYTAVSGHSDLSFNSKLISLSVETIILDLL